MKNLSGCFCRNIVHNGGVITSLLTEVLWENTSSFSPDISDSYFINGCTYQSHEATSIIHTGAGLGTQSPLLSYRI